MPSIQAKHSHRCARGSIWTTFRGAARGCTCPDGHLLYVEVREGRRVFREPICRDPALAQVALERVEHRLARSRPPQRSRLQFKIWAEHWLATLELKDT